MPIQQLEQIIEEEISENPLLETVENGESFDDESFETAGDIVDEFSDTNFSPNEELSYEPLPRTIDEPKDPFEFYRKIWEDDELAARRISLDNYDDEENEPFPVRQKVTFIEQMIQQLRLLSLKEEELILGEHILWNVDSDGYLRTPLEEIVDDTNEYILERNLEVQKAKIQIINSDNPANQYKIDPESKIRVEQLIGNSESTTSGSEKLLNPVSIDDAERVLKIIQELDPPGVASRNLQECLIAQTRVYPDNTHGKLEALRILTEAYELLSKKHFQNIQKQLNMTPEDIKIALNFIKKLNPKPGIDDTEPELNSIIPDFIIEKDSETGELVVILNESTIPALRISKTYEEMRREAVKRKEKEATAWLKAKYDDAKFLIQALSQRRATMLKVMTAIAERQKNFFVYGPSALKPMIYKDISEDTGLDVATVCRIVNNKFVQTDLGTFELKYFFSESLPTDDGEEVSTKVIKQVIKEIIDNEPKDQPYSDEKIVEELKKRGYNVARRTVAKYREQMKIPIARLRKEF